MPAAKGEHDIKSINELFIDKKDQSNLNRFLTKSQWNLQAVTQTGRNLILTNDELNSKVEYKLFDDSVVRKCSLQTEMTCYKHSSNDGNGA